MRSMVGRHFVANIGKNHNLVSWDNSPDFGINECYDVVPVSVGQEYRHSDRESGTSAKGDCPGVCRHPLMKCYPEAREARCGGLSHGAGSLPHVLGPLERGIGCWADFAICREMRVRLLKLSSCSLSIRIELARNRDIELGLRLGYRRTFVAPSERAGVRSRRLRHGIGARDLRRLRQIGASWQRREQIARPSVAFAVVRLRGDDGRSRQVTIFALADFEPISSAAAHETGEYAPTSLVPAFERNLGLGELAGAEQPGPRSPRDAARVEVEIDAAVDRALRMRISTALESLFHGR